MDDCLTADDRRWTIDDGRWTMDDNLSTTIRNRARIGAGPDTNNGRFTRKMRFVPDGAGTSGSATQPLYITLRHLISGPELAEHVAQNEMRLPVDSRVG